MKREIIAVGILVTLIILSLFSTNYVTDRANSIYGELEISGKYSAQGDEENALEHAEAALDGWLNLQKHAYIFLRQPEFDEVTNSFSELLCSLENNGTATPFEYRSLKLNMDSVISIEEVSIASIF